MGLRTVWGATTAIGLGIGAAGLGAGGALADSDAAAGSTNSSPSTSQTPAPGAASGGAASEAVTGDDVDEEVAEACIEELDEVERQLGRQGRTVAARQLRTLHQAATIFAQAGLDEACEAVVEGIGAYAEQQAGADDVTEDDGEARLGNLRDATPLAESGSRYRAGSLIGDQVVGTDGEAIGDVDDVMISADGSARFVLIGTGGLFGIAEEYVPVETERLRVVDPDTLALGMTADRFDRAPRVETERVDEDNERWAEEVEAWWSENVAPQEGSAE